jgi:hypothetical protein
VEGGLDTFALASFSDPIRARPRDERLKRREPKFFWFRTLALRREQRVAGVVPGGSNLVKELYFDENA